MQERSERWGEAVLGVKTLGIVWAVSKARKDFGEDGEIANGGVPGWSLQGLFCTRRINRNIYKGGGSAHPFARREFPVLLIDCPLESLTVAT